MALKIDDDRVSDQTPGYNKQSRYDPEALTDAENAKTDSAFDDIASNYDRNTADSSSEDANIDRLARGESNPSANWRNNFQASGAGQKDKSKKRFSLKNLSRKRAAWAIIGGGTAGGLVISTVLFFMPLKLEMFISNIYSQASRVPQYAMEQRMDYLVTRALSVRMLQMSEANVNANLVFCANGSISCSLFKTHTANYFERKYGISMEKLSKNAAGVHNLRITVRAEGRTGLGGRAQSWIVEADRLTGGDSKAMTNNTTQVINELDNGEMKKRIRATVAANMKNSHWTTRYLARKILMQKYGVTHWRAFPKTQAKAADLKTTVRSKMIANTIGKASGRLALAISCLSQTETCAKTYRELATSDIDLKTLQEAVDAAENGSDEKKAAEKKLEQARTRNDMLRQAGGMASLTEGAEDASNSSLRRFLSSRLLVVGGGALGAAGLLDLAMKGVGGIDDGVLDEIAMDLSTAAYVGLAFGDETGLVVNNEMMKAGDADIQVLGELNSYLDGAEESPLMAYENGISNEGRGLASLLLGQPAMASDGSKVSECVDGETDTLKPTRLAPGELICPEQKIVRDYTANFTKLPGWSTIAEVAAGWNASVGKFFDFINWAVGAIIEEIEPLARLMDMAGNLLAGPLTWLMGLIFDPPTVGAGATGAQNYVGLSGGIRTEQNELMQLGTDVSGNAAGAGGTILKPEQIAYINNHYDDIERQEFESKSYLAKLFDVRSKGSVAQQVALAMPTTPSSAISTLARLPTNLFAGLVSPSASAAVDPSYSPFGMPIYGYADTSVFTADPTTYSEEECEKLRIKREESLKKTDDYPVQVYTESDPCALEKMVVGVALAEAGVTDDEHSLQDPDAGMSQRGIDTAPPAGSSGDTFPIPDNVEFTTSGWRLKHNTDYSHIPCAEGSTEAGKFTNSKTGVTVLTCFIDDNYESEWTRVTSVMSGRVVAAKNEFKEMYKDEGLKLVINSGHRTFEQQQRLYSQNCRPVCKPLTAVPGTSNHEMGVAIDWGLAPKGANSGQSFCFPNGATCPGNKGYDFFVKHGKKYGFNKHPKEAWHWSMDGY